MTKPKTKKIYRFACGCVGPAVKPKKRLLCPKHLKPATFKVVYCKDCLRPFQMSLKARSIRCSKCQKAHYNIYKKKYNRDAASRVTGRTNVMCRSSPPRNSDCKFYAYCLNKLCIFDTHPGACTGCKRYAPVKIAATLKEEEAFPMMAR